MAKKRKPTKRKYKRRRKKNTFYDKIINLFAPFKSLVSLHYGGISISVLIIIFAAIWMLPKGCNSADEIRYSGVIVRDSLKKMKPTGLEYSIRIKEKEYQHLRMIGYVKKTGVHGDKFTQRLYGMVLRSLRFQNITNKVERKFNLPDNLILAMIMQESGGADLLPNSSDDGGVGLCHMQPLLASDFGLKTYANCKKLVCRKHGKELRGLIEEYRYDRKKLIDYDDRFHPVLNIDAAGRMLAYYMLGPKRRKDPVENAILGYAGSINYKKYYKNIEYYLNILNDEDFIDKVRKEFNHLNPNFTINNKKADFDDYIKAHQEMNLNYGIANYK